MNERIDHAAEALVRLPKPLDGVVPARVQVAQVHATLALVEQQRTANLIAYLALDEARGDTDYASSQIDALIRQGLGL